MDKDTSTKKQSTQRSWGILDHDKWSLFMPQWLFGLSFTVLSFYIGYYHGEFILPTSATESVVNTHISSRLAYAVCCSTPMILSLFAGIAMVGNKRALSSAVNPLSGHEDIVQVDKNYVLNTLEQFVIALTLMLTVAAYTDGLQVLRLLPVYSMVFTVGRILFWIGYSMHPLYRTTGMSMTLVSCYVMFGIVLYYSWTKGPAAVLGEALLPSDLNSMGHQEL